MQLLQVSAVREDTPEPMSAGKTSDNWLPATSGSEEVSSWISHAETLGNQEVEVSEMLQVRDCCEEGRILLYSLLHDMQHWAGQNRYLMCNFSATYSETILYNIAF